jgi:hypothetical protein
MQPINSRLAKLMDLYRQSFLSSHKYNQSNRSILLTSSLLAAYNDRTGSRAALAGMGIDISNQYLCLAVWPPIDRSPNIPASYVPSLASNLIALEIFRCKSYVHKHINFMTTDQCTPVSNESNCTLDFIFRRFVGFGPQNHWRTVS